MKPVSFILLLAVLFLSTASQAQGKIDSLFAGRDSTKVIDSLMNELDGFLDSLTAPHSFVSASLGVGSGLFSMQEKSSVYFRTEHKLVFMPSLGYFHKSGLGFSVSSSLLVDGGNLSAYQWVLSPSYDRIRRKYSAGISYSRYFTKDSLDFYTTPIENELYGYFAWKNWWLRPGISVSYGWGSRSSYERRKLARLARLLQRRNLYYLSVSKTETVQDFALTVSLRKDINWYDVLGNDDNLSLTPVILLNAGTQQFGFNTSYRLNQTPLVKVNALPSNNEISGANQFALQSLSFVLRAGYLKGNLLLQPQVYLDYALWETDQRFNAVYSFMVAWSIH